MKDSKNIQQSKAKRSFELAGRLAHKAATPFFKLYLRDNHIRVRVVIINDHTEILLVRSWFGSQKWSLPGGGIKSTETPPEAAVREVFEETGLRIAVDHLQEVGTFKNPNSKTPYTIACYKVDIPKRPPTIAKHRKLEMLEVEWFDLNKLPKDRSEVVDFGLDLASS